MPSFTAEGLSCGMAGIDGMFCDAKDVRRSAEAMSYVAASSRRDRADAMRGVCGTQEAKFLLD